MNNNGFTLIEILGAVTILGILSIVTIGAYTKYIYPPMEIMLSYKQDTLVVKLKNMNKKL